MEGQTNLMKKLWIFPALSVLFFSVWYQNNYHWFAGLLVMYWLIRLIFLRDKKILLVCFTLCILLGLVFKTNKVFNRTFIDPDQNEFIVFVKPTSFTIDGDLIKFNGKIHMDEKEENIVVRYYIETEDEKKIWQDNNIPKLFFIQGALDVPQENTNFHQFNYRKFLKRNNTYYELTANSLKEISNSKFNSMYPIEYRVDYMRTKLFDYIDNHLFGPTADYSKTLLFAQKNAISPEVMEMYRDMGLIHLLSISGLHIQLLISVIYTILLRLGITRETASKSLLLILPIYGLLAGFGVSVFRAVFQSIFRFTFILLNKPSSSLDNWSLTLLLTLFVFPTSIFSVGFQLSFLLSGSLIILTKARLFKEMNKKISAFILSGCINLISIPILSFHFFEFPWISLFMNILFVPIFSWILFPIIIILFLLSGILSNFWIFKQLVQLMNYLIKIMEMFLLSINQLDGTSFITGRLSLIGMVGLAIGIILIILSLEIKKRKLTTLVSGIIMTLFFLFSKQYSPVGLVMMVDVGQGESVIINPPFSNQAVMIDTGGKLEWMDKPAWKDRFNKFEIGTDILIPVLKSEGITSIEKLFITHSDTDHAGELENIIKGFSVGEIVITNPAFQSEIIRESENEFIKNNIMFHIVEPPETVSYGSIIFNIISPTNLKDISNEDSIVFYSEIGEYSWLFTGDIGEMTEKELVKNYPGLQVDILKVAHHGSNTSTSKEFLGAVKPNIGLISAGKNNPYNHPNINVVGRLTDKNIDIYRTDLDGAIKYQYSPIKLIDNYIDEFQTTRGTIE